LLYVTDLSMLVNMYAYDGQYINVLAQVRTHSNAAAGCVQQGYRHIRKQRTVDTRRTNVQQWFTYERSLPNVLQSIAHDLFPYHLNVHYPIVYSDHWAIVIVLTQSIADRSMIERSACGANGTLKAACVISGTSAHRKR